MQTRRASRWATARMRGHGWSRLFVRKQGGRWQLCPSSSPALHQPPCHRRTLLLTVAPSLRRCTSVRSRIASAMAASGMTCGAGDAAGHLSLVRRVKSAVGCAKGSCCVPCCRVLSASRKALPIPAATTHLPVLVAVLVLQAAARLQRRRVMHHLHDQRPARAHLRGRDVEAELQGRGTGMWHSEAAAVQQRKMATCVPAASQPGAACRPTAGCCL